VGCFKFLFNFAGHRKSVRKCKSQVTDESVTKSCD